MFPVFRPWFLLTFPSRALLPFISFPHAEQLSDPAFLSRLRPDQLRAQLEALETQYRREEEELRGRFERARAAVEGAMQRGPAV